MSILKAEVKVGTASDIGSTLDDILEGTHKNVTRFEGAVHALRDVAKQIEVMTREVEKDLDEGKYSQEDSGEPLVIAGCIKRWISRAAETCKAFAATTETRMIKEAGKAEGLQISVLTVKKVYDAEISKLRRLRETATTEVVSPDDVGRPKPRVEGERPGSTIKAQRLAEAAEPVAEPVAESEVEPVAESDAEPVAESEAESVAEPVEDKSEFQGMDARPSESPPGISRRRRGK